MTKPIHAPLTSADEIREFLKSSQQPFFYISRSATNLLGVDRWVGGFRYVVLHDSWDGERANVFSPSNVPSIEPRGNINVANWLLNNDQVQQYIASQTPPGFTPKIVVAMFDEETEQLCRKLGYELAMPSIALRTRLDSKVVTTQLGNEAGSPSVPNLLTTITGWEDLRAQAEAGGLGDQLVIQLPYGDSGRTTYFVNNHEDYERVASNIVGAEIKVMRHINHLPLAAEAVITRAGTVVGPVLRENTGHPELTRYRGGWSGSDLYPHMLSESAMERTQQMVERFGNRLAEEGYRGILEVSVLLDTDTDETYLGELNPRISGSSPHSNLTPGDTSPPLFAYHLLEYSDVEFTLDIEAIQAARAAAFADQTWSTLVIQYPGERVDRVVSAPRSGRYRVLDDGARLEFLAADPDWSSLQSADEVYWLQAVGEGDVRGRGLDMGLLVTRQRGQKDEYALTDRTKRLILAIQSLYSGTLLPQTLVYWRAGIRKLRGH